MHVTVSGKMCTNATTPDPVSGVWCQVSFRVESVSRYSRTRVHTSVMAQRRQMHMTTGLIGCDQWNITKMKFLGSTENTYVYNFHITWYLFNEQNVILQFGLHLLPSYHDDVIKWKHFPRNWPFVRGIHRSRWIPHTKTSDAELWSFLWSASE